MTICETPRLMLRHFHVADEEAMFAVFADEEVMRFGPGPQTREWVQRWLKGCLEVHYQKWGFGLWAAVHKEDSRVIGYCGLTRFDDIDGRVEVEIGYRLARQYWGQGLATEGAGAVRDHAFGALSLERLVSIIDSRNTASIRVAEKTGMRFEKEVVFRGNLRNLFVIERPRP